MAFKASKEFIFLPSFLVLGLYSTATSTILIFLIALQINSWSVSKPFVSIVILLKILLDIFCSLIKSQLLPY